MTGPSTAAGSGDASSGAGRPEDAASQPGGDEPGGGDWRPRTRLRTRVTLFFLFAALPAALISAGAVVILDRLIRAEIRGRSEETFAAVRRVLDLETDRISRALERVAKKDALRELADAVEHESALARAESLAGPLAGQMGLELFAVIALRGPAVGTIISSAHLPLAAGDTAPPFAFERSARTATSGFAHERVAGNPPQVVPALLGVYRVTDEDGKDALLLYGGIRLDAAYLEPIASMGGATLVLESPGLKTRRFGREQREDPPRLGRPSKRSPDPSSLVLPVLPAGRAIAEAGASGGDRAPTRITVAVDVERLQNARARFLILAGGLIVAAIALALIAGAWLSRRITEPILELSRAAAEVGAGRLDIRVRPGGNDEVGALIEVFNNMIAEIADSRERLTRAERVAAWREAARAIAHEIKNPLNPMQMAMETLRKAYEKKHPQLDEIVAESTKVVLDEVRSISRMVNGFSEFARLPRPKPEPIDSIELLEHASRLYGTTPPGIHLVLESEALRAKELPRVMADRDQIERALVNLVKNAIEAVTSKGGGTITLDAELVRRGSSTGVRLSVTDDGPGIASDLRDHLFTPYFTTKPDGTGLGLAIVERIVADHDGAIDVESPGKGATFRIWLPAARS